MSIQARICAALLLVSAVAAAETPTNASDKATEDQLFGGSPDGGMPADGGTATQQSADQKKTEDELFGGGAATPPATLPPAQATNPTTRENEAEDLTPIDPNALIAKTNENNDKLAIGGVVYLQSLFSQNSGPTKLGNATLSQSSLTSPNFMDLYLDARPTDRLRFYFRGRLYYIASLEGTTSSSGIGTTTTTLASGTQSTCTTALCPLLDQLWVKFDAFHHVFFTIGRQRIKWGAGRFWNPTDFLNPVKLIPLAIVDQRLGVDLIKVQVPVESLGLNFYAIAQLQDTAAPTSVGVAGRAEAVIGPAEITLSAAWRQMTPFKLGADISAGVGPFDLHAEAALLHPNGTNEVVTLGGTLGPGFYNPGAGITAVENGANPAVVFSLPTLNQHLGEWIPQVVAGGEVSIPYTDKNNLLIGAEYFYNDAGYSNTNVYPMLFLTGLFQPLYTGKHYVAAYVALPTPWHLTNTNFTLSTIGNLSDKSFITRFDYNVTVLTRLQIFAFAQVSYGDYGELHYGLNIPAASGVTLPGNVMPPGGLTAAQVDALLSGGLQIGAPLYTLGAGLNMSF